VTNISRADKCQIKEYLRIRYEDAEKIPQLCADILEEIKTSIPETITKGRPFRAMWDSYAEDHLKVLVNVHFNIRPTGQVRTEQKAMLGLE